MSAWANALSTCGLNPYNPLALPADKDTAPDEPRLPHGAPPEDPPPPPPPSRPQSLFSYLLGAAGPDGFGSRTTCDQVVQQYAPSAYGRTFLITGATSPVARALALSLAQAGARLVLGCRSLEQGQLLVKELTAAWPSGQAHALLCDLTSMQGAADAAASFKSLGRPLHTLVLHASTTQSSFALSPDGFEQHFATNHLAHCVLLEALMPLMLAEAQAAAGAAAAAAAKEELAAAGAPAAAEQGEGSEGCSRDRLEGVTQPRAGITAASTSEADDGAPGDESASDPVHVPAAEVGMRHEGGASTLARIVFVSCSTHYLSYKLLRGGRTPGMWRAAVQGASAARVFMPVQGFALSKLAQLLYMKELAERMERCGAPLLVEAVHPGLTQEGLNRLGGLPSGSWLHSAQGALVGGLQHLGLLKTAQQAAASIAFAALAPPTLLAVSRQQEEGQDEASGQADGWAAEGPHRASWGDAGEASGSSQHPPGGVYPAAPSAPSSSSCSGRLSWPAVSLSGRYIEDCRLSQPSVDARDDLAAAALYQVTQDIIRERFEAQGGLHAAVGGAPLLAAAVQQ